MESIYAEMNKDSMFYNDARRHMLRQMRKNVDNFEKKSEYFEALNVLLRIFENKLLFWILKFRKEDCILVLKRCIFQNLQLIE